MFEALTKHYSPIALGVLTFVAGSLFGALFTAAGTDLWQAMKRNWPRLRVVLRILLPSMPLLVLLPFVSLREPATQAHVFIGVAGGIVAVCLLFLPVYRALTKIATLVKRLSKTQDAIIKIVRHLDASEAARKPNVQIENRPESTPDR